MRKRALEGKNSHKQRDAAVKEKPRDADALSRLSSSCSSPTTEDDLCREDARDNGYYDCPMDLRKKSQRSPDYQSSDECDCTETESGPSHPSNSPTAITNYRKNTIPNALSATATAGAVLQPLSLANNDSFSRNVVPYMRKEQARPEKPERDSLTNEFYKTDQESDPTLSRLLGSRRISAQEEQQQQRLADADTPEVFSPPNTPPPFAKNHQDREVTRTTSYRKLLEVTNESLLERLVRVRCSSDNDIENHTNTSSPRSATSEGSASPLPRDQRSQSPTLKRWALTDITDPHCTPATDEASCKYPLINDEIFFNPGSPLCFTNCYLRALPETLLQHLWQLGPAPHPLSTYAYDRHIMQRLLEHELLKWHLEAMAPCGGLPNQRPSPAMLASRMAPCLETLEHDELVLDAGNQTDSFSGVVRKRATRVLTGKHVKQGTGASPSTLLTLREKIRERQRARELGRLAPGVRPLKGDKAKKGCGKSSSKGKKRTPK